MKKQLIYLPIETKSREFDSRCLIALACINQGKAVVISPAGRFRPTHPGVVLLKSAAGFQIDKIRQLKEQGMLCAVIDEEGFVQTRNETQRALRYSQETLDAVDRVFYNGKAEYDLLNKFYKINPEKGIITGNPRFDFYKPGLREYYRQDAEKLRKQYGPYILITSRFGEVNPARSIGYIDFIKNHRRIDSEEHLQIFKSFLTHSKNIYDAFLKLLPKLAKSFPKLKIIVRPHPSESASAWIQAGNNSANVKVISKGPIGPWILGAEAVLHNGCTTGLEAYQMGCRVYGYIPHKSEEFDLELPNSVSECYSSEESLIYAIKKDLARSDFFEADHEAKQQIAQMHMHNAGDSFAFSNITEQLNKDADRMPSVVLENLQKHADRHLIRDYLKRLKWNMAIRLSDMSISKFKFIDDYVYSLKKNPGFTKAEIRKNLEKLSKLSGIKLQNFTVTQIEQDVFLIFTDKSDF